MKCGWYFGYGNFERSKDVNKDFGVNTFKSFYDGEESLNILNCIDHKLISIYLYVRRILSEYKQ